VRTPISSSVDGLQKRNEKERRHQQRHRDKAVVRVRVRVKVKLKLKLNAEESSGRVSDSQHSLEWKEIVFQFTQSAPCTRRSK